MSDPNPKPPDEPEIKKPDSQKPDIGQAPPETEIRKSNPEQPDVEEPGEDLPN